MILPTHPSDGLFRFVLLGPSWEKSKCVTRVNIYAQVLCLLVKFWQHEISEVHGDWRLKKAFSLLFGKLGLVN